ncbi:hypothetical protein Csa_009488 [Cucumis sativus]|uniref:Pentatricopeptide repeat-containing protein n=1 Tax=Cucumis sativus TaxID=3659 RepID=A0A0A0L8N8_CUCSA|nr:hypothetical protein Csa_009488 [Cucumis sativus]
MGLSLVVLSNLYAKERRWEGVGEVRKVMNKMGVSKEGGGRSRIELINETNCVLIDLEERKEEINPSAQRKVGTSRCPHEWRATHLHYKEPSDL